MGRKGEEEEKKREGEEGGDEGESSMVRTERGVLTLRLVRCFHSMGVVGQLHLPINTREVTIPAGSSRRLLSAQRLTHGGRSPLPRPLCGPLSHLQHRLQLLQLPSLLLNLSSWLLLQLSQQQPCNVQHLLEATAGGVVGPSLINPIPPLSSYTEAPDQTSTLPGAAPAA